MVYSRIIVGWTGFAWGPKRLLQRGGQTLDVFTSKCVYRYIAWLLVCSPTSPGLGGSIRSVLGAECGVPCMVEYVLVDDGD